MRLLLFLLTNLAASFATNQNLQVTCESGLSYHLVGSPPNTVPGNQLVARGKQGPRGAKGEKGEKGEIDRDANELLAVRIDALSEKVADQSEANKRQDELIRRQGEVIKHQAGKIDRQAEEIGRQAEEINRQAGKIENLTALVAEQQRVNKQQEIFIEEQLSKCHLEPIENSIAPTVLSHNENVTLQCRKEFLPLGPQQRSCQNGLILPSLQSQPFVCKCDAENKRFVLTPSKGTIEEAQLMCRDMGGKVIEETLSDQGSRYHSQITQAIATAVNNGHRPWVGVRDFDRNGKFEFLTSRRSIVIEDMNLFTGWSGLDGVYGSAEERCAFFSSATSVGDVPCTSTYFGLCEVPYCN